MGEKEADHGSFYLMISLSTHGLRILGSKGTDDDKHLGAAESMHNSSRRIR